MTQAGPRLISAGPSGHSSLPETASRSCGPGVIDPEPWLPFLTTLRMDVKSPESVGCFPGLWVDGQGTAACARRFNLSWAPWTGTLGDIHDVREVIPRGSPERHARNHLFLAAVFLTAVFLAGAAAFFKGAAAFFAGAAFLAEAGAAAFLAGRGAFLAGAAFFAGAAFLAGAGAAAAFFAGAAFLAAAFFLTAMVFFRLGGGPVRPVGVLRGPVTALVFPRVRMTLEGICPMRSGGAATDTSPHGSAGKVSSRDTAGFPWKIKARTALPSFGNRLFRHGIPKRPRHRGTGC
ncbi:MAG: hypothetical protein JWM59_2839 [Verrucomicrobiales bacterium]|nr:hypothetical protein [Verrucomicrobiales bacterium]